MQKPLVLMRSALNSARCCIISSASGVFRFLGFGFLGNLSYPLKHEVSDRSVLQLKASKNKKKKH